MFAASKVNDESSGGEDLPVTDRVIRFLDEIGIDVVERPLATRTFLPGIHIDHGVIVIDRAAMRYPGDLLHEAGHLAVALPSERSLFHETFGDDGGMEMGAIAWSYAAAIHLQVPLDVLFHDGGYRGDAMWLREHFSSLRSLGVPILVWRAMTEYSLYPSMHAWTAPAPPVAP